MSISVTSVDVLSMLFSELSASEKKEFLEEILEWLKGENTKSADFLKKAIESME